MQVKPNEFEIGLGVLPANVFTTAQKWLDAMQIAELDLNAYLAHDALAAKAKHLFEQKQHNAAFTLTFRGMMIEPIAALNYAAVYLQLTDDLSWVTEGGHGGLRDFDHLRDWARLCRYIGSLLLICSHTLYKSFVLVENM